MLPCDRRVLAECLFQVARPLFVSHRLVSAPEPEVEPSELLELTERLRAQISNVASQHLISSRLSQAIHTTSNITCAVFWPGAGPAVCALAGRLFGGNRKFWKFASLSARLPPTLPRKQVTNPGRSCDQIGVNHP